MVKKEKTTSVNIPKSMKNRIIWLIERDYKGDYLSVDEFIREAIRLRLMELGAYPKSLQNKISTDIKLRKIESDGRDEVDEEMSSNHD